MADNPIPQAVQDTLAQLEIFRAYALALSTHAEVAAHPAALPDALRKVEAAYLALLEVLGTHPVATKFAAATMAEAMAVQAAPAPAPVPEEEL